MLTLAMPGTQAKGKSGVISAGALSPIYMIHGQFYVASSDFSNTRSQFFEAPYSSHHKTFPSTQSNANFIPYFSTLRNTPYLRTKGLKTHYPWGKHILDIAYVT